MKKTLCCLLLAAAVLVAGAGRNRRSEQNQMADRIWVSTDGNFSANASYSPATAPVDNDSVDFDGTSDVSVISNLAALTGARLTRLWTMPEYDGDIGASGNSLRVAIRRQIIQGRGSVWQTIESHTSTQYIVVDSPNESNALTVVAVTATSPGLHVLRGGVNILNGAGAFGNIFVGGNGSPSLPIVTIGTGVTAFNYIQKAGRVDTQSVLGDALGICMIDGGVLTVNKATTASWPSQIEIAGGRLEYNGTGTPSFIVVSSGTLDMSQDSRAKTITKLILFPGADFITHANITVTSLVDFRGDVPILP